MDHSNQKKLIKSLCKDPRIITGGLILLVIIFFSIFAHWIAPSSPTELDITQRLCPLSKTHLLGCDLNGGDVLTDLLYGGRISLYIGFLTVFICVTFGTLVGTISGFYGGKFDLILMRIIDILLAFPGILLAMVISSVLGPNLHNVVLAIAATGWISAARLVRGQVLAVKEQEFVLAARAVGASNLRSMILHILPQVIPILIVHATFSLSGVIIIEASLSFLGLGMQQGPPTWGALLAQGKTVLTEAPNLTLAPGFAIMIVVLSLNFLGDGLRDFFDPKSQKR